jgi:hypothetical protein
MTSIPLVAGPKARYTVKTTGGAVVCSEYIHPTSREPEIGTLLQRSGGRFYGGPWRVVDYRRGRGIDTNVLIVEADAVR